MTAYTFSDLPLTKKKKSDLTLLLEKHMKYVPGYAMGVVYQGRLYVYTQGETRKGSGLPVRIDTIFHLSSLTKVFTSILVMRLIEKGLLSLQARPTDLLDGFQFWASSKKKQPITIEHLLAHTSGLYGVFPAFYQGSCMSLRQHVYEELTQVRLLPKAECDCFYYSSANYNLLGFICEAVMGRPFDEVLRAEVIEPLGLADTGYQYDTYISSHRMAKGHLASLRSFSMLPSVADDPRFHPSTHLLSSIVDCAKIACLLCTGMTVDQKAILSEQTISNMMTRRATVYSDRGDHYGLGMSLKGIDDDIALHEGIGQGYYSKIYIKRCSQCAVVFLSNSQLYGCTSRLTHFLINELNPATPISAPKKELAKVPPISGWFGADDGFSYRTYFYHRDGRLYVDFYNIGDCKEEKEVPLQWDRTQNCYYVIVWSERKKVGFVKAGAKDMIFIGGLCFIPVPTEMRHISLQQYAGAYQGCMEMDTSNRVLHITMEDSHCLLSDIDGKLLRLTPFPGIEHCFSSQAGFVRFHQGENEISGFTLNYVQFFNRLKESEGEAEHEQRCS